MNAWTTQDENKEIRKQLGSSLSFEAVANKYSSRVELINSSIWTHKCCCPFHKNGQERTPSLHFSDTEKSFFCYGCSASGDIFDFIGFLKGSPGSAVAERYRISKNIPVDSLNVAEIRPRVDIHEFNLQLSVKIREYLKLASGTDKYQKEIEWTESVFKRMDERFDKLTEYDGDQARNFYMQILLELERRSG